jgi:hypothetical protein
MFLYRTNQASWKKVPQWKWDSILNFTQIWHNCFYFIIAGFSSL